MKLPEEVRYSLAMAMQEEIRNMRLQEAENAGRKEGSADTV